MPSRSPESAPQDLNWPDLLNEALTMPGSLGNTYNRFYSYSFLNQTLLFQQGLLEPVATYRRWLELGRQVKRGSRAKAILRPITVKLKDEVDEQGQPKQITKFKMVNAIFGVSETEGDELPEYEPPTWHADRALGSLAINRVAFESLDGNTAGYSVNRDVAINPVAPYPLKTLWHEMGHVVLGHTTPEELKRYQAHRGVHEFQAESTAYLGMKELEVPEGLWDASESRAYVQNWLHGVAPADKDIKAVFSATDKILRAGRKEGSAAFE